MIPGCFSGNDNYHYETKEIKQNQTEQLVEGALAIPVCEVQFEINLWTLEQGSVGLQILDNQLNGSQKAGPFESKYC